MSAGIGTFAAASFVAFLWPFRHRRLRRQGGVGKLDDIKSRHPAGSGFFYAPEARTWITAYPRRRAPEGRGGLLRARSSPACERGHHRPVPEVPAPRLPRAAMRHAANGSSARATARSTTASARRRVVRHHAAWTTSRVTVGGNGDVTVDTGVVVTRPADRHQHHRPGGRGAALHRADASTDARALATTSIAWVLFADHRRSGWIVYAVAQHRAGRRARARFRDRAGGQPQAVLRRRGARGSAPRPRAAHRRAHARHHRRSACRCTGCSSRRGRPVPPKARRSGSSSGARRCSRRPATTGGVQLRRLPRRDEGRRRRRRVQRHRPATGEVAGRRVVRAGAEHRLLPLRRRGGAVHHRLRPAVLADVAVGRRRRRPDERPADRHAASPTSRASRSTARTAPRARTTRCVCDVGHLPGRRSRPDIDDAARRQAVEDGEYATLRRGAVQPRPRQRRLQLRSVPHAGMELRANPACRGQGAFGWNLTGGADRHALPDRATT